MKTAEPIRNKQQIKELAAYYLQRGKIRNYVLIVMGVYTALRISDLLSLTWGDVYNFEQGKFNTHINLTERKTGKKKSIAVNKKCAAAMQMLFAFKGDEAQANEYLFQSSKRKNAPIGRVQAWRIVKAAAVGIGLTARVSCHSLRKTFGYHAWQAGVSIVLLMDIYNHTSYKVTQRYLGVAQDDLDKVYNSMAFI